MIKATKPFIPKINNNVNKIRTGVEVPQDGVNLSHFYTPPLVSGENIVIGDNTIFTMANDKQEVMMVSDVDYILKDEVTGMSVVDGELVEITDKFFGDIPLYYCYKLSNQFYGETSLLSGMYFGDSISIEDMYGNDIPTKYKYIIYLKRSDMRGKPIDTSKYILSQIYDVYIYTSFQIENNFRIRCKYNALVKDESYRIEANCKEYINPQPFFKKASNVLATIEDNESYFMQKSTEKVRSSMIHIGSVIEDPRNPQLIRIRLDVTFDDGTMDAIYFPDNEHERIKLYNKNSIIDGEQDMFENDKQILSKFDVATYFDKKGIVKITPHIVQIDVGIQNIEIYVRPDGLGKLYAKTTLEQIKIDESDIRKLSSKDENILTTYAIKMKDRKPIKLLKPRETDSINSWYVRVQNGKYTLEDGNTSYHYFIPEYYSQVFDKRYGYPYKRVNKERPEIIGSNAIKVKCAPLFIGDTDDIKVVKVKEDLTTTELKIESWNNNDGVINLVDFVNENDYIAVDYVYEEDSFVYTGYSFNSDNSFRSVCLDCNPNKHHYVSVVNLDGTIVDVPTFTLLDKMVYVYIRPAIIVSGDSRTYNDTVIIHSFDKLPPEKVENDKLQLIGILYIRPNSSFFSLSLDDSRSRGGGITESITDELRKLLEPESDYYWDIGYWDGEPFNECGVVIVKIDKSILIKNGGKFTEDQVEIAVNKHLAYGTLAIIEYVTTYNYEDITVSNLEVTDYINA